MIRFFLRFFGYLAVGAGFVALVLDGARSIANQSLMMTRFGETLFRLFGESYLKLQPAIEKNLHPFLWDPVLLALSQAPSFVIGLVLGFLMLRLGRRPDPGVGYLTRA